MRMACGSATFKGREFERRCFSAPVRNRRRRRFELVRLGESISDLHHSRNVPRHLRVFQDRSVLRGDNPCWMSALAKISGQPYKTSCLPKTLTWRGAQRYSIILQLGFLLFCKVSATAVTDSPVAAADWNSFRQSIGPPEASLGQKATRIAEIVTRVTESFGTANGYLSQARATSPAESTIFYTPLEREPIGRLWPVGNNRKL